jgi:hypothetical protein
LVKQLRICVDTRDSGQREGPTSADQKRVKELDREVKELRGANEIRKLASAFFAQEELDQQIQVLRSFFDADRNDFVVEPICRRSQIAPSGYRRQAAQLHSPSPRYQRAHLDESGTDKPTFRSMGLPRSGGNWGANRADATPSACA